MAGVASTYSFSSPLYSIAFNAAAGVFTDLITNDIQNLSDLGDSVVQNTAGSAILEFAPKISDVQTDGLVYAGGKVVEEINDAYGDMLNGVGLASIGNLTTPATPKKQLSWFMEDIQSAYDNHIGKIYKLGSGKYRCM